MLWKVGILTTSDKGSRGEREDTSAQVIRELVEQEMNGEVIEYKVVPDEPDRIEASLIEMCDQLEADLILTTGGTGLARRDVTPEATLRVLDRLASGFVEAMRSTSLARSPNAMLSRAVSGIRGNTLIINLPGSPKGVRENLEVIIHQLPHALAVLSGHIEEHKQ